MTRLVFSSPTDYSKLTKILVPKLLFKIPYFLIVLATKRLVNSAPLCVSIIRNLQTMTFKMRHILYILLLILSSCSVPKQVGWDRVEEGNVRHIGSKSMETKIDNATYNISLTVFSGAKSKYYCLLISSLWRIDNNNIVLLKIGNGETIKLISDNINKGQVDWPSYSPIIGGNSNSGILTTKKADYYSSIYSLDDYVLRKIEQYGVYKIRIEFANTYKEQIWKNDKLGRYLKTAHELLESQLQMPSSSSKSIEQDF